MSAVRRQPYAIRVCSIGCHSQKPSVQPRALREAKQSLPGPSHSSQQLPMCKSWKAGLQGRTPELLVLILLPSCSEAAVPRVCTWSEDMPQSLQTACSEVLM